MDRHNSFLCLWVCCYAFNPCYLIIVNLLYTNITFFPTIFADLSIHPRLVLPSKLEAVVGTTTFDLPSPQQQIIPVLSVVNHDRFESTTKLHDIALVSVRVVKLFHYGIF